MTRAYNIQFTLIRGNFCTDTSDLQQPLSHKPRFAIFTPWQWKHKREGSQCPRSELTLSQSPITLSAEAVPTTTHAKMQQSAASDRIRATSAPWNDSRHTGGGEWRRTVGGGGWIQTNNSQINVFVFFFVCLFSKNSMSFKIVKCQSSGSRLG